MEQRYFIKFMFIEGYSPNEIISKLSDIYGDQALHKTQVYYWLAEIKRGRDDLRDEQRTGRPCTEFLDDQIKACININPHFSCRVIASMISSSGSTVYRRLTLLGYKSLLLRWVPHKLNQYQKHMRFTTAKNMLKILQILKHDNCKYIVSGDESWFSYYYDNKRQWVLDSNDVDERVEKTHFSNKTMITIFISINGLALLDVKPSNQSINAEYFINNILTPLEVNVNAAEAKKHRKLFYVHYDNALAPTSQTVKEHLEKSDLTLMPHPAYSPDLSPCDFGLFGTVKDSFAGRSFSSEKDLIEAIENFFFEKPKNFWESIFNNWMTRLQKCIDVKGDYF